MGSFLLVFLIAAIIRSGLRNTLADSGLTPGAGPGERMFTQPTADGTRLAE